MLSIRQIIKSLRVTLSLFLYLSVLLLDLQPIVAEEQYLFSSGRTVISRTNLRDLERQEIVGYDYWPKGAVGIDTARGKVYWYDSYRDQIQRANLDGSYPEVFISAYNVTLISIDVSSSKVFWSNSSSSLGEVWRCNYDKTEESRVIDEIPNLSGMAVSGGYLYWLERGANSNDGSVHRSNLDGTNRETLFSGLNSPKAIAVDNIGNRIYYKEKIGLSSSEEIKSASFSGSNAQLVVASSSQLSDVIEFSQSNNQLYYLNNAYPCFITRINPDGTGSDSLASHDSCGGFGIGYNGTSIFLTEQYQGSQRGIIYKYNLDGTDFRRVFEPVTFFANGMDIDQSTGNIYWADSSGQRIQRVGIGGENPQTIISTSHSPCDISLDSSNSVIYWSDCSDNKIKRSSFSGDATQDVLSAASLGALKFTSQENKLYYVSSADLTAILEWYK